MDLFKEALELAGNREGVSPEIARRMQEAMMRRAMHGAGVVPGTGSAEAAVEQGQQLHVGRHHLLDQPAAPMPPGFTDPLYKSALAQLQHWMARNERYRNQGEFERLESVFQAVKEALG